MRIVAPVLSPRCGLAHLHVSLTRREHARARARAHPARLRRPRRPHLAVAPAAHLPLQERLEALLVAAYDEIKADLSGDAARRERLEAHCERLELESRMAWQSLRRIAGVCRAAARTLD